MTWQAQFVWVEIIFFLKFFDQNYVARNITGKKYGMKLEDDWMSDRRLTVKLTVTDAQESNDGIFKIRV